MSTVITDKGGKVIRQSRNLRGVLDHARRTPVDIVLLEDTLSNGKYRVCFAFKNGDRAVTTFADWRVAADWVAARNSWGIVMTAGKPEFVDRYVANMRGR